MTILLCGKDPVGTFDVDVERPTASVWRNRRWLMGATCSALGSVHTVSFEAPEKLYEFARLVRFARKIAATDRAAGDLPLFF
jgi:hypothetical protein